MRPLCPRIRYAQAPWRQGVWGCHTPFSTFIFLYCQGHKRGACAMGGGGEIRTDSKGGGLRSLWPFLRMRGRGLDVHGGGQPAVRLPHRSVPRTRKRYQNDTENSTTRTTHLFPPQNAAGKCVELQVRILDFWCFSSSSFSPQKFCRNISRINRCTRFRHLREKSRPEN